MAEQNEKKVINCCGDCANYNWKKHKCNICNNVESDPRSKFYDDCPLDSVQDLNAIITRQQAEIERSKKDREDIDKFAWGICKERMLQGKSIADFDDLQGYIQKQKVEAVREFAERLKKHFASPNMHKMIDKIAEEMVGETEWKRS